MSNTTQLRPTRKAHLKWHRVGDLVVNPVAQRELRKTHAEGIRNGFDIEKFTPPTVSERDGKVFILDGQHRTWAYREVFGEDAQIQCFTYSDLDEAGEADLFLLLNTVKTVNGMDKFKVAVTAGHQMECEIDRIVRALGCKVSSCTTDKGNIAAVGTLTTIFKRYGGVVMAATIRSIRDSFGDGGYEAQILMGVAMVMARHDISGDDMTKALLGIRGGSKGLVQAASRNTATYGVDRNQATAVAVVEGVNKGRRGRSKLPHWLTSEVAS